MSTYLIASGSIKDAEKFAVYGAQAAPTFAPYGGTLVQKGKLKATLTGTPGSSITAIFAFTDPDAAIAWHASAAYQALLPLRDAPCEMSLSVYAAPDQKDISSG
ncbi:MAG: DUF1330 domain-containing protein [Halieaceae bacterium]|jgi:uncharacterized protein (DUF1330 family)|uniref:DUF1330 domain-containing protein n=1 Tax=Haliea alexandrii TaxID=2448162 RepID=UPI000F0BD071|nr:DUF1330 domain-containing protein [Haliea alexandrii]MCR9183996.1 DUF1330 domain-containing protein [Halieaceae bacterium]